MRSGHRTARVVRTLAVLVVLTTLASPSATPAFGSPLRANVSLARGWLHFPMIAPGIPQPASYPYVHNGPTQIVQRGPGLVAFSPTLPGVGTGIWTSADGRVWKSVPLGPPAFQPGDRVLHLYAAGPLLIMTGWLSGGTFGGLWVSTNGTTWRRVQFGPEVGPVAAGGDGVISFTPWGLVMTSADGLTWRSVQHPVSGACCLGNVTSVTRGGPGLVAGGYFGAPPGAQRVALWTSHDGLTWSQVPNDHALFGPFGAHQRIYFVQVVGGPRGILALGRSTNDSVQDRVVIWASRDGVHWRRGASNPFNAEDVFLGRVIAWQQGFVGLSDEGGETVVWSSPDGLSWMRVGSDELFGGTARVVSVTGFRGGVAAVGSFAPHPQPACLSTSAPSKLRTFRPATFLWSPGRSRSAPPPRVDALDPRTLKLLPSDLPPKLQPAFYSTGLDAYAAYQGGYVNLCQEDPALRRHRAYFLFLADALHGQALSIVTEGIPAARAAFRQADRLVFSPDPFVFSPDLLTTILGKRELPARVRIGEETRLFKLRVDEQLCGDVATASLKDLDCVDNYYQSFAVVWRQGRVIGGVVADSRDLATSLAKKQLAHLQRPNPL